MRLRFIGADKYEASVASGYLSQLEKGVYYVSLRIVGRLAEALQVEPAEFLKMPPKRGPSMKGIARPIVSP
jgi:transcriptional regulator with XRE-family HTH domain